MAGIGFQIGAMHIGFQLKAAGRHAHRLGKFGFELLRHANQRAVAGGDKALAAPQRFAMAVNKARGTDDNLRDRRYQPLQFSEIVLLLDLAGFLLLTSNDQRYQQQVEHRRAKAAGHKPYALDPGINIQNAIAGASYRALRI